MFALFRTCVCLLFVFAKTSEAIREQLFDDDISFGLRRRLEQGSALFTDSFNTTIDLLDLELEVNVDIADQVSLLVGGEHIPDEQVVGMVEAAKQVADVAKIGLMVAKVILMFAKPFAEDMARDVFQDMLQGWTAKRGTTPKGATAKTQPEKNQLHVDVSTYDQISVNLQTAVATEESQITEESRMPADSSSLLATHVSKTLESAFLTVQQGHSFGAAGLAEVARLLDDPIMVQVNVSTADKVTVNVDTKVATEGSRIEESASPSSQADAQIARAAARAIEGATSSRRRDQQESLHKAEKREPKIKVQVNMKMQDSIGIRVGTDAIAGGQAVDVMQRLLASSLQLAEQLAKQVAQTIEATLSRQASASSGLAQQGPVARAMSGWSAQVNVASSDTVEVNIDTRVATGSSQISNVDRIATSPSSLAAKQESVALQPSASREVEVSTHDSVRVDVDLNVATEESEISPAGQAPPTRSSGALAPRGINIDLWDGLSWVVEGLSTVFGFGRRRSVKVTTLDNVSVRVNADVATDSSRIIGQAENRTAVSVESHPFKEVKVWLWPRFPLWGRTNKKVLEVDVSTHDHVSVNVDTNIATRGSRITRTDHQGRASSSSLVAERVATELARGQLADSSNRTDTPRVYDVRIKVASYDHVTVSMGTNVAAGSSQIATTRRRPGTSSMMDSSRQTARQRAAWWRWWLWKPEDDTTHVNVTTSDDVTVNVRTNVAAGSGNIDEIHH